MRVVGECDRQVGDGSDPILKAFLNEAGTVVGAVGSALLFDEKDVHQLARGCRRCTDSAGAAGQEERGGDGVAHRQLRAKFCSRGARGKAKKGAGVAALRRPFWWVTQDPLAWRPRASSSKSAAPPTARSRARRHGRTEWLRWARSSWRTRRARRARRARWARRARRARRIGRRSRTCRRRRPTTSRGCSVRARTAGRIWWRSAAQSGAANSGGAASASSSRSASRLGASS